LSTHLPAPEIANELYLSRTPPAHPQEPAAAPVTPTASARVARSPGCRACAASLSRSGRILPHHVQDDLVGDEFAAVEIPLDGQAQAGPPRHVIAQQFTGRDAGDAEVRGDQRALSPLARARRRDHQYPHPHLLTSSSRLPARPVDTLADRTGGG